MCCLSCLLKQNRFFCKKIICNFILVAKHICNYFLRRRVGYLDRKFSALKEVLNEQQYGEEGLCIERFISFKIKTRKDTGFKSLQSITQVIKKCKMWTGFSRIFTWLPYSVVFVKKINLLSLRQCCFLEIYNFLTIAFLKNNSEQLLLYWLLRVCVLTLEFV